MKRSFSSGLYENSMLFDDFTEASISASFSLRKKKKEKDHTPLFHDNKGHTGEETAIQIFAMKVTGLESDLFNSCC